MGGVKWWHSVPFRTSSPADDSPLGYTCNYMQLIINAKLEVLLTEYYSVSIKHSTQQH